MSGDVQPRKRKDKKKKKDDLSVEEPRGTAAALGEGDVYIHSQQDHVTGGHWCAKIIFFSLLAVLITLIGLIILENRGLTELEANAVESRYSGVLEGWLEDAPDDDHHDEHTLDLKHHDDDEEDEDHHNVEELEHDEEDHDDEEDQDDEEDHEDEESHEVDTEADEDELDQEESHEDNTEADEEDEEENIASNEVDSNEEQDDNESEENLQDDDDEDVEEKVTYKRYLYNEDKDEDDANDDDQYDDKEYGDQNDEDGEDDLNEDDDDRNDDNDDQNDDYDDQKDNDEDQNDNLDEQNYNAEQNEDQSIEHNNYQYGDYGDSKKIKQDEDFSNEILYDNDKDGDEDNESNEQKNNQNNEDEEEQGDDSQEDDEEEVEKIEKEIIEDSNEIVAHRNYDERQASKEDREADNDDENDLQDQEDDDDEPPLERITAPPAGKPFVEIEEEVIEKPINTLAEEEEYEKRQEQLRREEEEAAQGSQTWLKLAVGGALLVATHAVLRRATAPRDIPEPEEHSREETPIVDRRMTITHEQFPPRVQESPLTQIAREIEDEVFKKPAPVTRSAPVVKQDSEEKVIVNKGPVLEKPLVVDTKDEEKELYSDEEEEEEVEDDEEEDIEEPLKEIQKKIVEQKPTEDSEPEDVEIIDDEQIEEELEDEEIEDEEEISDVDDTELLTRLEAKYGRLPEPERFGRQPDSFGPKHKDGGNSIEDDWPGEPSDAYWRTELNVAEEELRQGAWSACERRVSAAELSGSGRARWLAARAADLAAEAKRDNGLLSRAIAAYLQLLKMNERLSDYKLLEVAQRAIDRIQFRGTYLNAEPIYRLLIRRFPNDVNYRNNLTVSFLMANRADLADEVLKETLRLWPDDRVALAHHGFVLKTKYNKLEEAVKSLYKALEGDTGPANEPRFYYHLGDALLLLGRPEEAHEVHKRGAALGHFLSPAQRSLYNVPRLRSRPWWPIEETPYVNLARALESSWKEILKEGEAAKALYEKEKEGLKERGDWTQLDLFVRGAEIPGRCARAPATCAIVRREVAAARCRRGQVKFSAMAPGTHVRAHVGPTNCRLRMHLGLSNTKDTYIRVDKETRQWQTGKTFIFDDSFEHEVWHNGTGARLVLIVDVWHPDLTAQERRTLPAI